MNFIDSSVEIIDDINSDLILKKIELALRNCYKSENLIEDGSAEKLIKSCINRGHESPLEHVSITYRVICDRACYDKQTQVLTNNGWKYFYDLLDDDLILTLDENNDLVYIKPTEVISYKYTGDMYSFQSSQIDLLVTPNHKMWVFDYNKRSPLTRIWKFIEAQSCTNGRYVFNKSSNGINRTGMKKFLIKGYTIQKGIYDFTYEDKIYNSIPFLKLIGLWLTDGYCCNRKDCSSLEGGITQIKKDVREIIENLLVELGIKYTKTDKGFDFNDQPLLHWLQDTFLQKNDNKKTYYLKLPRDFINSLNRDELQSLLEGIILGDGSKITNSTGHVVYTASYDFAQDLSEIALLIGLNSNIRKQSPREKTFPNGKTCLCKEQYIVSINEKTTHLFDTRHAQKQIIQYNDMVYCVELPKYHRLFVQRNGKSVWCGNCSHEWVRHRLASYSQESSRYCNYTKGKFGSEITYIKPEWFDEYQSLILKPACDTTQEEYNKISIYFAYKKALETAELSYFTMIRNGATPDIARAVLPNSLKTDLICTMNIRELRNFFKLRCTKYAHPAIRKLAIELLQKLKEKGLGILFEDIIYD